MKHITILGMGLLYLICMNAQITLNPALNRIRPGDEIVKQQVLYKDPGKSGENILWDFSTLQPENENYFLSYFSPELRDGSFYIMGRDTIQASGIEREDLITGIEHHTAYYYRYSGDTLYHYGHANQVASFRFDRPIPVAFLSMQYGQQFCSDFQAEGIYSGTLTSFLRGTICITADAWGKIILPEKDTLYNVIRIKAERYLEEKPDLDSSEVSLGISPGKTETFQWYAEGYRYPVFETIRTLSFANGTWQENFNTSFYSPPSGHTYLDDDPENRMLAEIHKSIHSEENGILSWFSFHSTPNPVATTARIEYRIEREAIVSLNIVDVYGNNTPIFPNRKLQPGVYEESVDISSGLPGVYSLLFEINGIIIEGKLIKK